MPVTVSCSSVNSSQEQSILSSSSRAYSSPFCIHGIFKHLFIPLVVSVIHISDASTCFGAKKGSRIFVHLSLSPMSLNHATDPGCEDHGWNLPPTMSVNKCFSSRTHDKPCMHILDQCLLCFSGCLPHLSSLYICWMLCPKAHCNNPIIVPL